MVFDINLSLFLMLQYVTRRNYNVNGTKNKTCQNDIFSENIFVVTTCVLLNCDRVVVKVSKKKQSIFEHVN